MWMYEVVLLFSLLVSLEKGVKDIDDWVGLKEFKEIVDVFGEMILEGKFLLVEI